MEKSNESSMGEIAQERGFSYVPECYKVEDSIRPCLDPKNARMPIVDLDGMSNPTQRPRVAKDIENACRRTGFFHVINHGISQPILDGAISAASGFLNLPNEGKAKFLSNDVHNPVRYGTSVKDGEDNVQYWRVFLKHYAHPLKEWIGLWPNTPSDYREKMGEYTMEVQKLALKIIGIITEFLGLGPAYLTNKLDNGLQVMTVNSYPSCPQPELALGLPPHTDYCCLTILLQDSPGLQILDSDDKSWKLVPVIKSALQVHVGDQLEVLSNGRYKSLVHRVTVNSERARFSVASLHSLGLDVKMHVAKELVDEDNQNRYKESSFRDFLNFISKNDIGKGKSFLNTIMKIQEK
ncbi:hypothetical protein ACJIZ3_009431 [Penstemon smallii]|uniref:Fe2OG dioxygenase domain-containing protein n=1 Tax=Penstemon smallii TaxID=265156 RepID=A0ABD3TCI1_9LAMI